MIKSKETTVHASVDIKNWVWVPHFFLNMALRTKTVPSHPPPSSTGGLDTI